MAKTREAVKRAIWTKRDKCLREYAHSGRVHKGQCYRCRERKLVKIETTIGRGVHLCKPCLTALRVEA